MNWHEDNEHELIVEAIEKIPTDERDYDLIGALGRAYNNLNRFEEAIAQFMLIAIEGQDDPLWHYRLGYAYFHSRQYEQAVSTFTKVMELNPEDEESKDFLKWSQVQLERDRQNESIRNLALQRRKEMPKKPPFEGMDLANFWDDSSYALKEYVLDPPSDELIASVEDELGYKLPSSYIALMKQHNGGVPYNTNFPTEIGTSWAEDHIAITGIMGIGRDKQYALCGDLGSQFMIEDWGYPDIGVVICDCPSAGHDVVMLDYRHCGKDGEPEVIHVDQESDYEITFLAPDFESFITGLVNDEEFDTSEEDKQQDLETVANGRFSPLLTELCSYVTDAKVIEDIEGKIRAVCTRVVEEKGHFSFHADELSYLMYDVQFWLYSNVYPKPTRDDYLGVYDKMIAFGGDFGQGGYAPGWITEWLDRRISEGKIKNENGVLMLTDEAREDVIARLVEAAK